jgi:hypothetical protein
MESSHTAELDIPELNAAASKAHIFPGMANHSLLSVGQLCDEGYIVTFKQASVTICDSEKSQILSGPRDLNTGLWRINLKQTNNRIPEPIANNVYELRNTGALVHYLHKSLFSPTKSAMLQAVKDGHLITWPGLTEDAINKHLKLTPATAMGHMNQRRQKISSTSKAPIGNQPTPDTDLGTKTHLVYAVVVDQGQLYTDLTGKFPVRSSKGNSYVMVCYVYECNYVKFIPMKSRSASEWVKAYDTIHQELTVKGSKPKIQTLNNEASAALKNFFTANDVDYQLVPPHCHRRNAAERAIRNFKEHFVAGLSSVDPAFPLHLWDILLLQAEITLNLSGPRDCILNSPPRLTSTASWITTKQILLCQNAKKLHTRNQESDALGHPTGNMDILWVPRCIITDVKMYTYRPRPVNASWILSSSFPTIIKCHSYLQPTD